MRYCSSRTWYQRLAKIFNPVASLRRRRRRLIKPQVEALEYRTVPTDLSNLQNLLPMVFSTGPTAFTTVQNLLPTIFNTTQNQNLPNQNLPVSVPGSNQALVNVNALAPIVSLFDSLGNPLISTGGSPPTGGGSQVNVSGGVDLTTLNNLYAVNSNSLGGILVGGPLKPPKMGLLVTFRGGNLTIGDGGLRGTPGGSPPTLVVTQNANHTVSVGDGGSTNNLGTFPVKGDITIQLSSAASTTTIALGGHSTAGSIIYTAGNGADSVTVTGGGTIKANLSITAGTGNDSVSLGTTAVTGSETLNLGGGADTVTTSGNVGGNLSMSLGSGADSVTVDGAVKGGMSWQFGTGNDTVTIGNAPGGLLSWNSGNGNDSVTFGDATNAPGLWNVHMQFGTGADTLTLAGNGTVAMPNQLTGSVDLNQPPGSNSFDPTGSLAAGTWIIVSPFTLQSAGIATIQFTAGVLMISPGSNEVGLGTFGAPLVITQTAPNTYSVRDGAAVVVPGIGPVTDIQVTGGVGNDFITLELNALVYTGSFEANTGSGSDTVLVQSTGGPGSIRGNLSITSGDGNDSVGVGQSGTVSVGANLSMNLGSGNDSVTVASTTTVNGNLNASLGGGADSVTVDATVNSGTTWQLGNGNDTVTMGSAPGGLLSWNSGNGNDSVTFGDATNVPGLWNVHMQFGTGSDTITLAGNGTVATPNQLTGSIDLSAPSAGNSFDPTLSLVAGTWVIASPFNVRSAGVASLQFAAGVLMISPGSGELGLGTFGSPLLITQSAQNSFTLRDGATEAVTFSGVTDIQVTGGIGNDFVTLSLNGLTYTGSFEANTGSGNDTVQVLNGTVQGNLSITSGNGNDSIGVGQSSTVSVGTNLSINLGSGNDTLTFGNNAPVGSNLNVTLGGGADIVTVDATVNGGMTWQVGNGNDTVTIGNAPAGQLNWNSGNGNDSVTFGDATNIPGLWNLQMQFGTGADTLTLAGNGTVATPNQLTGSVNLNQPPGSNSFDPTGSTGAGTWIIASPFTLQSAGVATIQFVSGVLTISPGSGEAGLGTSGSPLLIRQSATNSFTVSDGATAVATVSGPVTDIQVAGGVGNDFITLDLNGLTYTGSFEANTGSGKDTVQVQGPGGAIRGNLSITSGNGNDNVGVNSHISIGGNLTIHLGNGNDSIAIAPGIGNNTTISHDLNITLGGGADSVTVDATVNGGMNWQLGLGNDTVTMGSAPGGLLSWNSGNGNDSVTFGDATNVPGLWSVQMQFGTGADTLTLAGNGTVAMPNQLTGSINMGGPLGGNQFDPTGSLVAGTWIIAQPFNIQNV